jgi:hypothetical protein
VYSRARLRSASAACCSRVLSEISSRRLPTAYEQKSAISVHRAHPSFDLLADLVPTIAVPLTEGVSGDEPESERDAASCVRGS